MVWGMESRSSMEVEEAEGRIVAEADAAQRGNVGEAEIQRGDYKCLVKGKFRNTTLRRQLRGMAQSPTEKTIIQLGKLRTDGKHTKSDLFCRLVKKLEEREEKYKGYNGI